MNSTNQQNKIYGVIIAGAGPVGLFLACELALVKCSVLILEKTEQPQSALKQIPFGIRGLSAPTIEALYRRGLFDELEIHKRMKNPHAHAVQGPRRQVGHFAGIPFHEGDVDPTQWKYRLTSSTDTSLLSEMQELETIFTKRALSLGVEILRGTPITGFDQTEQGVTVHSGDKSFVCKWLVGCDGSRSAVRKSARFEFAGTEPAFTGYTVQAVIADPEKLSPGRNITERGMYLQSQPGYLQIQDFDGGAFHSSHQPVTREHVQQVLRRISNTDVTISEVIIATTWSDRARQATKYRDRRVLLAGDAAHIHAPLGGQGLNLGLSDAMNLGWKLAATIQDRAPDGLLDSYFAERHPVGVQVLDWSRAQVAIMKPDQEARALQAIMRDLLNTRDGATYMACRVWGIDLHYPVSGKHPLTGHSVPNFLFEDGTTIAERMTDGKGIVLDFDKNSALHTIASLYGDQIKYLAIRANDQLGFSALLIRPDGIIAWVSDRNPDASEIEAAADRWFVKR